MTRLLTRRGLLVAAAGLAAGLGGGVVVAERGRERRPVGGSAVLRNLGQAGRPPDRGAATPVPPNVRSLATASLSPKWQYQTGGAIVSSPVASDGLVYVGSRDSHLYAMDLATGEMVWRFACGDGIDSSPLVVGDVVCFASRDGHLYALRRNDGALLWKHRTGGRDVSSPAAAAGLIFAGSSFPNRYVFAVRQSDGSVVWRSDTCQMVYSSPRVAGNDLYVGSNDGRLYALDRRTGLPRWVVATSGGVRFASPAVDSQSIFLAPGDQDPDLYAVDARDGQVRWRVPLGGDYVSSPVVAGGVVYVQAGDFAGRKAGGFASAHVLRLYALDARSGELRWKVDTGTAGTEGLAPTPAVQDGLVYVASGDGWLYALGASNGQIAARYQAAEGFVSSPTVAGDTVLIGGYRGTLFAFAVPVVSSAGRQGSPAGRVPGTSVGFAGERAGRVAGEAGGGATGGRNIQEGIRKEGAEVGIFNACGGALHSVFLPSIFSRAYDLAGATR